MESVSNSEALQVPCIFKRYPDFYRFLVIKIAGRVQQISREKCIGCVSGFILDQLHPCMGICIMKKIERFLPKAKYDALTRLDELFAMYAKNAWIEDEVAHKEAAIIFIELLQPRHVMDRRYINEDSVREHPFDDSWLVDATPEVQVESTLPPIAALEPTTVKGRKRKRPQSAETI